MTATIRTSIRCGSKVRDAINRLTERYGAIATPLEFVCRRCHQRWSNDDISIDADLKRVTCSNCYADPEQVLIVRVKLTVITAKDLAS